MARDFAARSPLVMQLARDSFMRANDFEYRRAIENVRPRIEVKSRRVGGSNYQVPVEVNPNRRLSLSIRWLVGFARARGDG